MIRILEPVTNARLDRIGSDSWISFNLSGRMVVQHPDLSRLFGPDGESRGLVFYWRGDFFAVTVTVEPGPTPVWIIRQLFGWGGAVNWTADAPAIVVRGQGFDLMSARLDGDVLRCVGCDAQSGRLQVRDVDLTQEFRPYIRVPDVVVPVALPSMPPVPTSMPAVWIGLCTTFIGPGNCSWGNPIP